MVANFVGVNKIRVCISILQKHAFWTTRNQNLNPIVQKGAYMKNRKGGWQSIIVKNVILLIIDPFYFLIIVKNGVLLKNKNSEITHWFFCKLQGLNCNLLNYTGKYEYENEYDDEYDLKKW